MGSNTFGDFLGMALVLVVVGFVVSAMLTPPDPFTQLLVLAALLPAVLVVSYVLTYRLEFTLT